MMQQSSVPCFVCLLGAKRRDILEKDKKRIAIYIQP